MLADFVSENHPHCWERARWWWDSREELTQARRFGVEGLPLELLAPEAQGAALRRLRPRCLRGRGTPGERAAFAILLQESGDPFAALDLFGDELGESARQVQDEVTRLLKREAWKPVLVEALRTCAPWQLQATLSAYRSGRKGRLRLFAFPAQSGQKRCALMLVDGPRFIVESTRSNQRVPEVAWKRTPDLETLLRGRATPSLLDSAQRKTRAT